MSLSFPWLGQLNGARQRALLEIGEWGAASPELLRALEDEKYEHAAEMLRTSDWAKEHRFTAARLGHQISTGEQQ